MKQIKYYLIFLSLSVVYIYLYNTHIEVDRSTLSYIGGLGLLQFVFVFCSWMSCGKKIISPYFIFIIVLYVFSFGQSLLYPFGLICEKRDLYETYANLYHFSVKDIYMAQLQTLLMLNVFHLGGLRSSTKIKNSLDNFQNEWDEVQLLRLKHIGWFFFCISIIPFSYDTIMDMIQSMTYGYGSLYGTSAKVGFDNAASFVAALFIPSVISLFIVYSNDTTIRRFLVGIILLVVVAILLTGGRSHAVILLSILVVLYEYFVKPFSKKMLVIGALCGIFLLQLLAFIAATRTSSHGLTIENMDFSDNSVVEAVSEMGWSQFCLIESMKIVPDQQDFRFGRSYFYAFTSVIPNMGFWEYHPAKTESNLGEWLSDYLGTSFGTGFSMCAEAWVNFGVLGFLLFYLWGLMLGSLFGRIEETICVGNVALSAFILILFWFSLTIPRNAFLNIVRAVFYYAAPIYYYSNNFRLWSK